MTDYGPCEDWPVYWTCDVSTYSPELTGYAVSAATRVLWALSGRRFGQCEVTWRPCAEDCADPGAVPLWGWGTGYSTTPWDFYRLPYCAGACQGGCSCAYLSTIRLPDNVSRVVEVKLDGTPMVTGSYRLDGRSLIRTDGSAWPRCNNLALDDDQPGTWSVKVVVGEEVPDSGRLAMGELACEIAKAGTGADCRLPPGVTQLVRQGVTIQYPDMGQLLKDGRTGLYLVDLFLASENPDGLSRRGRVYNVDRVLRRQM
ncbi:hypothetical protein [Streptomyces sp. NRRL S-455]|uniref:hypothetical protein n=1 Tax=Streptomyces sp. NRRL S-455 TaxID=1463908 RepID=UPI0004C0B293|nr:hypothetical protein [Streptomyces sp. NRRL S-455]